MAETHELSRLGQIVVPFKYLSSADVLTVRLELIVNSSPFTYIEASSAGHLVKHRQNTNI